MLYIVAIKISRVGILNLWRRLLSVCSSSRLSCRPCHWTTVWLYCAQQISNYRSHIKCEELVSQKRLIWYVCDHSLSWELVLFSAFLPKHHFLQVVEVRFSVSCYLGYPPCTFHNLSYQIESWNHQFCSSIVGFKKHSLILITEFSFLVFLGIFTLCKSLTPRDPQSAKCGMTDHKVNWVICRELIFDSKTRTVCDCIHYSCTLWWWLCWIGRNRS